MKQFSSIIYKRFLQKTERTTTYQSTTILSIPETISVFDLTILPEQNFEISSTTATNILLPLAGTITLEHPTINKDLPPSSLAIISDGLSIAGLKVINPYMDEAINCIAIQLKTEQSQNEFITIKLPHFEILKDHFHLTIRQFGNREEYEFMPSFLEQELIVVCLAGAFEFENRLLEDREALRLTPNEKCEMESLVKGSILLFIQYF